MLFFLVAVASDEFMERQTATAEPVREPNSSTDTRLSAQPNRFVLCMIKDILATNESHSYRT